MIDRWIIPIMGFTQDAGHQNGFDRLWLSLRKYASETTSLVTPQRWRARFDWLAEFILRHSSEKPEIVIIAYSWGCGHGFLKLMKELGKRGLNVRHAILCDPVYHSWTRPWRALVFSPEIAIPENLKGDVWWLRQFENRPQATDLIETSEDTTIHRPIILKRTHEYMDDAPEFHQLVAKVLAQ